MKKEDKKLLIYRGMVIGAIMMFILIAIISILIKPETTKNYFIGYEDGYNWRVTQEGYLFHPEVINGNLYIGYYDGKRIGYNYFNESWYCNGIKLNETKLT